MTIWRAPARPVIFKTHEFFTMCGNGQTIVPFIIPLVVNGNGASPTTGVQAGDLCINYPFQIAGWDLMADQVGSIQLDVWIKAAAAGSPPTVANTIIGGGGSKPALVAAQSLFNQSVTNWTTSFASGSYIRWNLDSIATITQFTLQLRARRVL